MVDLRRNEALVLAPTGRDADIACRLLREASIPALACKDIRACVRQLGDHTTFLVLADEALIGTEVRRLANWIASQPSWSDFPVLVLTHHGVTELNPRAAQLSSLLGDVTFLERPFHPATFISLARSAVRSRLRQYEARARMEELRESEESLRVALDAGHLGSWEFDVDAGTLSCSATCKAVFGRAAEATFDYADLLAAIHPDDLDRMQAAVRRSIESGVDYAIEYRTLWPDGSAHWAEVRARRVEGPVGGGVRLVGVSSDITARKTVEERLRQLNESLEERVAVRTEALNRTHAAIVEEMEQRQRVEDQLRQAQKMEAVGQLTGGVAHDFNNLLMAVLGNLQLLRKRLPSDPKLRHLVDGSIQGAERGAALTKRLLAFARRQELSVGPVDVSDLARGMEDLLVRSVGQGIRIEWQLGNNLPPANADANQLELALLNLVVNARDALPEGGVVTIALDACTADGGGELEAGNYLRLSVADTGIGMDPSTLERAIDPFFSTKEVGRGTGLGLSMIHGLAVQLSGALKLRSKPGEGTTAELWLPVASSSQALIAPTAAPAASPQLDRPARILAVDDDALILMSTVDMLEDLGHSVISAHSGAKALELMREGAQIDLLITDFSMPGMSGSELARSARALRPDLPILLATGYAELPDNSDNSLPRLSKPYQQDQLAAEIARVLLSQDA
jgi:PAS domain S-box-containing protein